MLPGHNFFSGLITALLISLLLWALIAMAYFAFVQGESW